VKLSIRQISEIFKSDRDPNKCGIAARIERGRDFDNIRADQVHTLQTTHHLLRLKHSISILGLAPDMPRPSELGAIQLVNMGR